MKKELLILILSILVCHLNIVSAANSQFPTKLRITVIDGLGNFVEGATIKIYENEENYRKSTNPIAEAKSDKKGKVTFNKLKDIPYYIEAYTEDKNNNGEGVLTGKLASGKINKVNTVIE